MTNEPVPLNDLVEVQEELPKLLLDRLTNTQKEFLLSFQQAEPKWDLFSVGHLRELSEIQWKLMNLRKMDKQKHKEMGKNLEKVLESQL